MIIGEAHLLHLTTRVFFAGCRFWVAERDYRIAQLPLLLSMAHIHMVDIEGVFGEALVGGGSVKDKDRNMIWICGLEDLDCGLELIDERGELPRCAKPSTGF